MAASQRFASKSGEIGQNFPLEIVNAFRSPFLILNLSTFISSVTCSQIWLIPLVMMHPSPNHLPHKFGKKTICEFIYFLFLLLKKKQIFSHTTPLPPFPSPNPTNPQAHYFDLGEP
jgi:hypothetical protein